MYDKIKRFSRKNPVCERLIYTVFLVYGFLYNLFCRLLCVFPIQKNKIVCSNFKGRHYADNPKYITEALLHSQGNYDIVWLLRKGAEAELPAGVRRVTYGSFSGLKELMTASMWLDSHTKQYGIYKRKGQFFFETAHGSYGLKKIGTDQNNMSLVDSRIYPYNVRRYDLMLSNSRQATEIYRRAFGYAGEMLEYGSPRNDVFFRDSQPFIEKVSSHFNITDGRLALYAPTWRPNFNTDFMSMDFEKIRESLHIRFGGQWNLLIRMHPENTRDAENVVKYGAGLYNATDYNDMQELLVACDILITDYSSCMFDFATCGKPCFLYAPDVEAYREAQDYYLDIFNLPFPLGRDTAELEQKILNFDMDNYHGKLKLLQEQVGLNETGQASEYAAQYIEKWLNREGS